MKITKEDCLQAIASLELGDSAEVFTPLPEGLQGAIEPGIYVMWTLPKKDNRVLGTMRVRCRITTNDNEHGRWLCLVDAGSIQITCTPKQLQQAYEHAKAWLLR